MRHTGRLNVNVNTRRSSLASFSLRVREVLHREGSEYVDSPVTIRYNALKRIFLDRTAPQSHEMIAPKAAAQDAHNDWREANERE